MDASALQHHSPRTWISVSVMSSTASGWTWEESRTNTPPLDFTAMKYVSQRLYSLDASLHRGTASSTTGRDGSYSGSGMRVGGRAWCRVPTLPRSQTQTCHPPVDC